MKRFTPLTLLIASSLIAGSIQYNWETSSADVQIDSYGEWDVISIAGGLPVFANGYPNLPAIPSCYVIPQGMTVTRVEVTNISTVSLGNALLPLPIAIFPLSGDIPDFPNYTESCLEGMLDIFPSSPIAGFKTGTKTGFRLGSYSFVPFIYNQQTGELSLITSAEINLIYEQDPEAPIYYLTENQVELAKKVLSTFIKNPEILDIWSPAQRAETDDDLDVVVIGYAQQSGQLDDLVEMHIDWGFSTECATIQWIIANVEGFDPQEKIRNYLKSLYENNGLQFVVMCGDYGASTRLSSLEDPAGPYLMTTETDLYFSDLDGMWDGDGDHMYGEEEDGIDYYSDVYVGRYPAGITETDALITMIEKTSLYASQPEPGEWRTRALLLGGIIDTYFGDYEWCHGSKHCDSVATFFPTEFQWDTVYEDSTGGHPNNQLELFNQGSSFMVYAAHGNPEAFYWYYPGMVEILSCDSVSIMENGSKLPWVDGIVSCNTGRIGMPNWNIEGICEMMFQQSTGGAVIAMGYSTTAYAMLYEPGPAGWLSIYHAYMLFDQNLRLAGVTLAGAKDMMWANFNSFYCPRLTEWSLQGLNLLGDPCTAFVGSQEGIENQSTQRPTVHVTPNPACTTMSLSFSLPNAASVTVFVYDMFGRISKPTMEELLEAGEQSLAIDVSDLPEGMYMVSVVTGDYARSVKCIVLH